MIDRHTARSHNDARRSCSFLSQTFLQLYVNISTTTTTTTTTMTVLWPFLRTYPGKPEPEETTTYRPDS